MVEFIVCCYVVFLANSTGHLNVNLGTDIYSFWYSLCFLLNFVDSLDVVLGQTSNVDKHKDWNVVVERNIHDQKAI